jgi:hypothetical protein
MNIRNARTTVLFKICESFISTSYAWMTLKLHIPAQLLMLYNPMVVLSSYDNVRLVFRLPLSYKCPVAKTKLIFGVYALFSIWAYITYWVIPRKYYIINFGRNVVVDRRKFLRGHKFLVRHKFSDHRKKILS